MSIPWPVEISYEIFQSHNAHDGKFPNLEYDLKSDNKLTHAYTQIYSITNINFSRLNTAHVLV